MNTALYPVCRIHRPREFRVCDSRRTSPDPRKSGRRGSSFAVRKLFLVSFKVNPDWQIRGGFVAA
jgi:hypothetical protein